MFRRFVVYVIICQRPNHIYIGFSQNYYHRMQQHQLGWGARFTQAHGVLWSGILRRSGSVKAAKYWEALYYRRLKEAWPDLHLAGAGNTSSDCCVVRA